MKYILAPISDPFLYKVIHHRNIDSIIDYLKLKETFGHHQREIARTTEEQHNKAVNHDMKGGIRKNL